MKLRMAHKGDIAQLIELRIQMQLEVNYAQKSDPNYPEKLREYFEQAIIDGTYYGGACEIDGKVISTNAFILYRKPPALGQSTGLSAYVSNVFTLPEFRNRGIGQKLFAFTLEEVKKMGVEKFHLGATESGSTIYKKCGFTQPRFESLELRV